MWRVTTLTIRRWDACIPDISTATRRTRDHKHQHCRCSRTLHMHSYWTPTRSALTTWRGNITASPLVPCAAWRAILDLPTALPLPPYCLQDARGTARAARCAAYRYPSEPTYHHSCIFCGLLASLRWHAHLALPWHGLRRIFLRAFISVWTRFGLNTFSLLSPAWRHRDALALRSAVRSPSNLRCQHLLRARVLAELLPTSHFLLLAAGALTSAMGFRFIWPFVLRGSDTW